MTNKKMITVLKYMLFLALVTSCVEAIDFSVPPANDLIVVEGSITNEIGPYVVKVTRGIDLNANRSEVTPIANLNILLLDDLGNQEMFEEVSPGEYHTKGEMVGQIGRAYHIRITTTSNEIFESTPEVLQPVGALEAIKLEFVAQTTLKNGVEVPNDIFRVLIDASAGDGANKFVRWRYQGIYKVATVPELHMITSPSYLPYKSPLPCSGYVIAAFIPGGRLLKVDECTCCECWSKQFESIPQLSDGQLVVNNQYRNVQVGEIPINNATFFDKYLVIVEQMSLSKAAFDFFNLVKAQKDGASSLFQPPSGEIKGNIQPINNNRQVVGLFYATSISKMHRFIYPSDLPYLLPPLVVKPDDETTKLFLFPDLAYYYYLQNSTRPCTDQFPNATYLKPALWED